MNRDVDAAAGEFDYLDIDSLVDDWYRRGRYGVDAFAVIALSFFPSSDHQTRKDLIFAWASVFQKNDRQDTISIVSFLLMDIKFRRRGLRG